ncbi:TPA: type II secretion system minor pseudopilin GspH [Stenotrophomonas maltophilia]|uniref:type II secretion system minor pseudopilin GspH n=1 Tax=Stenotrophomonas TaxID=40323 RepID=UPI0013107E41|nr:MULTISPECIES: type II secretion system minor pseudopilin GspH [unclassified Stenotrophomonas]MBN5159974.1 type II secretion system minor pseudopilin GspH [Stenotrophomonas maltophilia]MDG9844524.1 type II secretion system minor pseudopilin GspH [Stenotrophomonas sp. GD04054]MDH0019195.1 type II secretion system minor pseudopilin GspH [Stenotrophomonas sp. GD04028]MDH0576059.1 type II secretion system minor pseudopilin GspH [Stenotrophomonas sp. GD03997]MDH0860343.1 type II secretion system 
MQRVPRGFTLLELMVVLVIIGICTAGIGLGLGSLLDPGRQLRQEGERLAQRLQVARDEARIDGRPLRWQADAAGYRFSRLEGSRWVTVERDDLLRPQKWQAAGIAVQPTNAIELSPEWIGTAWELGLSLDGRALRLRDDGSGQLQVVQ